MNTTKKFGSFSSSEDPQKLAATVTGAIIGCSSLIIFGLGRLGLPVSVEQVTTYAGVLGTAVGAIWTLYGLIRKAVIAFATRNQPQV